MSYLKRQKGNFDNNQWSGSPDKFLPETNETDQSEIGQNYTVDTGRFGDTASQCNASLAQWKLVELVRGHQA